MKIPAEFKNALILPGLFVLIIWLVKIIEVSLGTGFSEWGLYPRTISGMKGILFYPFLHGDWEHLFSNTFPIIMLGMGIRYFFKVVAHQVFLMIYLLSGILLWIGGGEGYHIGASGLIYGFAAFLFFSGVLSRNYRLWALSLLIVFLYGGLIWGLLPVQPGVSWEGHLFGAIAGIIASVTFRKYAPQRKKYSWEEESEEESNEPHMHLWDHKKFFPPPEDN